MFYHAFFIYFCYKLLNFFVPGPTPRLLTLVKSIKYMSKIYEYYYVESYYLIKEIK